MKRFLGALLKENPNITLEASQIDNIVEQVRRACKSQHLSCLVPLMLAFWAPLALICHFCADIQRG